MEELNKRIEEEKKRVEQAKLDFEKVLRDHERQVRKCQELEDNLIGLIPILKLNGLLKDFEIDPVSLPGE